MSRGGEFAIKRYEVFLRDVLTPAIYPRAWAAQVRAWRHTDIASAPPTFQHAASQIFEQVEPGWQWGPKWSTCWFRVSGVAPVHSGPLHLRFSTATEALVYLPQGNGPPRILQGLDVNRDALLNHPIASGQSFEFFIEAACNHPFGVSGFEWDSAEMHARWKGYAPGRLDRCEIAAFSPPAESLARRYVFVLDLLKELQAQPSHFGPLNEALRAATNAVSDQDVAGSSDIALKILDEALASGAEADASSCVAVGHAHIDTAWLWPLRETRRKCLRTFSNVLGLLERNPEFHFMCSQAQQYEFVRQDNPDLFARISKAVESGRWEPVGGMWVEPDANCPSGESLIRQCLHATRYWTSHFGIKAKQRLLFLPDTFGFPASLPGIMKHCGLDSFITNKLHWNATNDFPYATFDWEGIDGSVVLAHNTPGKNYNATMTPRELRRGRQIFDRCHPPAHASPNAPVPPIWFQPFGYGDGGGGPTQTMIDFARLAVHAPGLPRTHLGSTRDFLNELHARREAGIKSDGQFPVVKGELYLELHRGTLTTQAWIKKANREAEAALQGAEFLAFFAPIRPSRELSESIMADLDRAWKLLLLNQFHDILPGSSIGWVYEDARKQFQEIADACESIKERALPLWKDGFATQPGIALVINPYDTTRCEPSPDRTASIVIEPFSIAQMQSPRSSLRQACSGDATTLRNGMIEVMLDAGGRITGVVHENAFFPDALPRRALLNQLVMYEDHPHAWDAWEIDPSYVEKPEIVNDTPCESELVECSPQRIAVRFTRKFGAASRIAQTISLRSGSARITVLNEIDWHEDHRLLRVLHGMESSATEALCGVQCGSVWRPLVPRDSFEAAKFEFCAHGFVAFGQAGSGLAAICPEKYGWSARRDGDHAVIGTSLLRAPKFPDPTADRGRHVFEYGLTPLLTPPIPDILTHEADLMGNDPVVVHAGSQASQDEPFTRIDISERSWAPFQISASCGARVRVMCAKRAEDDPDTLIVRLHETAGVGGVLKIHWALPVVGAQLANGLEIPTVISKSRIVWNAQERTIMSRIWPFGILAFRVKLDPTQPVTMIAPKPEW